MFGDVLRGYRRRGGLTQEELASQAGVGLRTIRDLETGRIRQPRPSTARRLADALQLTSPDREGFLHASMFAAPDHGAQGTSPDRPVPVPAQLPCDVFGFTGRRAELLKLDELLATGCDRRELVIATVSGTAGVGKTALAIHWARQGADRFPDGQLYLDLRGFHRHGSPLPAAEALRSLLGALGVPAGRLPADLDELSGLYRSVMCGKRILVLLDNARDAEQARPLLPGGTGALVLITSRNQLTGLLAADGAHPIILDLLSTVDARDLLARRLGAQQVSREPAAVQAVIAACARLPLALTIAAARARETGFPLATLAADLCAAGRRLDVLDTGDPAGRVRAVFSWSYTALTPAAASLFRLLGLHPGPDVSTAAAARLAALPVAEARPVLSELTRANLLTEHTSGRYACHDLLHTYAAELVHLADGDRERDAARSRMLDHYLHTAVHADRLLNPLRHPIAPTAGSPGTGGEDLAHEAAALAWFTVEHHVLRAAVEQAFRSGSDAHAWRLAWALETFFQRRGHWPDQAKTQRTALAAAQRLGDRAAEAEAHRGLANAYLRLDRHQEAQFHYLRALERLAQIDDHVGQARVHCNLALVAERHRNHAEALSHAEQALHLFERAQDRAGQATALNTIGYQHALQGAYHKALAYCHQALSLQQQVHDPRDEAGTWNSLGYIHHQLGEYGDALRCHHRSLVLSRICRDRYNHARSLIALGDTHHAMDHPAAAADSWRPALSILDDLAHPDADPVRGKLRSLTSPRGSRAT